MKLTEAWGSSESSNEETSLQPALVSIRMVAFQSSFY